MKLWVDDERPAPDETWTIATSGGSAILLIGLHSDDLEEISLDHDLGLSATGYDVLTAMSTHKWWPKTLTIHTANPVGRANMLRAANAEAPPEVDIYVKYW